MLLAGCWRTNVPEPIASRAPEGRPACLPDAQRYFHMARVGADIVLCGESDNWDIGWGPGDDVPLKAECFTMRADGTLRERPFAPLPGISFNYEGPCAGKICWSERRARIAYHPDGVRAALIDQYDVKVYDVASGRATSELHADIPGDFWFIGETLYIESRPAAASSGLRAFALDGTKTDVPGSMWHGNITLTDAHHLMFEAGGLQSLELLDGKSSPQRLRERRIPAGPCEPVDYGEYGADDADDACKAHLARTYGPYDRSLIVADGPRLVGFLPSRREVFVLDAATLAETSRVRAKTCGR